MGHQIQQTRHNLDKQPTQSSKLIFEKTTLVHRPSEPLHFENVFVSSCNERVSWGKFTGGLDNFSRADPFLIHDITIQLNVLYRDCGIGLLIQLMNNSVNIALFSQTCSSCPCFAISVDLSEILIEAFAKLDVLLLENETVLLF